MTGSARPMLVATAILSGPRHVAREVDPVLRRWLPLPEEHGSDSLAGIHVFVLDEDELGVVVGDIAGHDVNAAAVMGQARSMLRCFAIHDGGDPGQTLDAVDHIIRHSGSPGSPPASTHV